MCLNEMKNKHEFSNFCKWMWLKKLVHYSIILFVIRNLYTLKRKSMKIVDIVIRNENQFCVPTKN